MQSSRALTGAIIAGSVAVAAMFAASPAAAATLPSGQKITVIDQWGDQFYNVDPANGVSTPVGTPTGIDEFESGVDVDDTGLGYAVATYWQYDNEVRVDAVPEGEPALEERAEEGEGETDDEVAPLAFPEYPWTPDGASVYKANANTGALTDEKYVVIDLPGDEDPFAYDCTAIDYSKGVIVAACYTYGDGYEEGYIGTLDVTSDPEYAYLTPKVVPENEGLLYITAIALNPITGLYWAFDSHYGEIYTFGLDYDYVDFEQTEHDYAVLGADFDRSGQLWLSVAEYQEEDLAAAALNPSFMQLATLDFAALNVVPIAPFASEDPYEITAPEALTVWGVPALAATGGSVSLTPVIAASGILLLGAMLAAGTMVLRRRNAEV